MYSMPRKSFHIKDMDQKIILDPSGPDHTKISECKFCQPYVIFLSFKDIDKKPQLSNFEADRTNISEVRADWHYW